MKQIAPLLSVLLCVAMPVLAQEAGDMLGLATDQPITVNADAFAADLRGESGTYTGHVVVTQGAIKLRADEVTITAPGGRATRMEASGNVVVDMPSGTAVGDTAVYDIVAQIVRLSGDVALTNNNNILRGSVLEVEVETGRARLTGGANAVQIDGQGRVQGLFTPSPQGGSASGDP